MMVDTMLLPKEVLSALKKPKNLLLILIEVGKDPQIKAEVALKLTTNPSPDLTLKILHNPEATNMLISKLPFHQEQRNPRVMIPQSTLTQLAIVD